MLNSHLSCEAFYSAIHQSVDLLERQTLPLGAGVLTVSSWKVTGRVFPASSTGLRHISVIHSDGAQCLFELRSTSASHAASTTVVTERVAPTDIAEFGT
jgi:hypothetical protein